MLPGHIVCFGNELHGDDGFGYHIYLKLIELAWPEDVAVFYAGIAGINALDFIQNCRWAILVDALMDKGQAGEVLVLKPTELPTGNRPSSSHDNGLQHLLELMHAVYDQCPEITIVGAVVPGVQPFTPGLTAPALKAIPEAIRIIRRLAQA